MRMIFLLLKLNINISNKIFIKFYGLYSNLQYCFMYHIPILTLHTHPDKVDDDDEDDDTDADDDA